jgi:dihydrofolate reductase
MNTLSLIVALDRKGLIGRNQALPWHLPADLKHFKSVTLGKPVIMGRRTCESIGRPLSGRRNLVVTRNADFRPAGFEIFHDAKSTLAAVRDAAETVVIGGAEIYQLFWPEITQAYVTLVDGEYDGDTWFRPWPLSGWDLVSSVERPPDSTNPCPLRFLQFIKVEKN